MDWTKWPAIWGYAAGALLLSGATASTFVLDRPVHTSIVVLASTGASIIGISRLLPRSGGDRSHDGRRYSAVPLEEIGVPHASREPSPSAEDVRYPSSLRKLRIVFLVLVAAICIRVEILREMVKNIQCKTAPWSPFIPMALAMIQYFTVGHRSSAQVTDDPDSSVYTVLHQRLSGSPYRYIATTTAFSLASQAAIAILSSPRSTFICPAALPYRWVVPTSQFFGTCLDVIMCYCLSQLLHQQDGRGRRSIALRFASVGWALLFPAILTSLGGLMFYYLTPQDRIWITTLPRLYFWSLIKLDVLLCFTALCALLTMYHIGVTTTAMIGMFVALVTKTLGYAWTNVHPFPPWSTSLALLVVAAVLGSFYMYFFVDATAKAESLSAVSVTFSRPPAWLLLLLLILFSVHVSLWATHGSSVTYHPIDMLLYNAQSRHQAYVNQTHTSSTLHDAAETYRQRYNRHPPPGFQHWYEYATARNSMIIDDFDSIYRDLLPFYALTPSEIRKRTWLMIANPWNDVAGISIRKGVVTISPNVVPTHRWMLDGVVAMINQFAEHLPDMDLGFNLNDECRVAVPYEIIAGLKQLGASSYVVPKASNAFSAERAESWLLIPEEEPIQASPLIQQSFQNTFYDFGSVGCPPSSAARTHRVWDVSELCTACTSPHSLGAFLSNWTLAADVCHQPDLANLHGLFLSPAAFKGAHELYPIFSQSKVPGFNDILYPSAWNYMDKVKYDPNPSHPDVPFAHKNSTLFWRGATSEGVSGVGQWQGMTRQRFIHLSNTIRVNGTAARAAPQALLLPQPTSVEVHRWQTQSSFVNTSTYAFLPTALLTRLLRTDIHIVDMIARCWDKDCVHQAEEFAPLLPPTDFQDHWAYKFLLDLDGAGFSGRFLPFLQSNSLPFKAGLFREWWDDRVTAWMHFVPLDVRGQGFWATLAYFTGLDGQVLTGPKGGGEDGSVGTLARGYKWLTKVKVEPHEREAERIAMEGRKWAEKVLRKEDMEIYMFRLLLEWGRLTDEGRDGIGYAEDVP